MSISRLPALGSLRAFEAAARLSSFKAAAQELCVTPGAISQQIRGLEEELDVKLFTRSVRAVTLTEAGRDLQPALSDAFCLMATALERVRPRQSAPLRIESSGPIIRKWLLPRLHRLSERHPDLAVTVSSHPTLSPVGGDGPDVTIRFTAEPTPGLHYRALGQEIIAPFASPALVERLALYVPRDLVRAPLVHDTSNQPFKDGFGWPDWLSWFARSGLDPAGAHRGMRFSKTEADHAIDAAIGGAGVVLGRYFLARDDIAQGRLVAPFGLTDCLDLKYYVVCKAGDEHRDDVAAFMEWMCDEAKEAAPAAPSVGLGCQFASRFSA